MLLPRQRGMFRLVLVSPQVLSVFNHWLLNSALMVLQVEIDILEVDRIER
jgi:hypothetical protein